jgi:hypothetical protein
VIRFVDALVDTPAEVFNERAVDPRIDLGDLKSRIDGQLCVPHVCSFAFAEVSWFSP